MQFTVRNPQFTLQQFKAFYCYHFVKSAIESASEITFTVDKDKVDNFVSCLIHQHLKFDALHQNLAMLNSATQLQRKLIDEYQRVKLMIKQLLDCIHENPEITIEDLNA